MTNSGVILIINEDDAQKALMDWCRRHNTRVYHWYTCIYTEFPGRPAYWAIVVRLFNISGPYDGVYGLHVYDTGEVKMIGRVERPA